MDTKDFYLNTPMKCPEFMHLKYDILPEEIIAKYGLAQKVLNGWVFVHIEKGMYGLPQAGLLANKLLASRLDTHGYYQCQFTPGLWHHKWRPVTFSLVVDNFVIKTVGITHAKHLKEVLQKYYTVSVDWTGDIFCGISLNWDYRGKTIDLSMPGYIKKLSSAFSIHLCLNHNMRPTKVPPFSLAIQPKSRSPTQLPHSPKLKSNIFKKSLVPSCITHIP
ncbi:hypothetical protein ACHAW6_002279 [Cyclotella cf. meneghiniana]